MKKVLLHIIYQDSLIEVSMTQKQAENTNVDKRRNLDLMILKTLGGPFTKSEEVRTYSTCENISDEKKSKRLYLEVRYCRDTCLSLPKSSDLFRLKKKL